MTNGQKQNEDRDAASQPDRQQESPAHRPEPARGAENPLDQRQAHQDRGMVQLGQEGDREDQQDQAENTPSGEPPHPPGRSRGEGDVRFRNED